MDTYKYDHVPHKHWVRYALAALITTVAIVGLMVALFAWANSRKAKAPMPGGSAFVPQPSTTATKRTVFDEPLYSLELPSDWKVTATMPHNITWQATLKGADN